MEPTGTYAADLSITPGATLRWTPFNCLSLSKRKRYCPYRGLPYWMTGLRCWLIGTHGFGHGRTPEHSAEPSQSSAFLPSPLFLFLSSALLLHFLIRTEPGDSPMELLEGKTSCKKLLTLMLFTFVLSFCIFVSFRQYRTPETEQNSFQSCAQIAPTENNSTLANSKPEMTVLLWTWPFGQRFNFRNCAELYSIRDCHFTVNRSWLPKADAVIVHHRDVLRNPRELTKVTRIPSQRWIWFNLESPTHSPNLLPMDNLFNLTMSYRKDSDIFSPYGELQVLEQPQPFSIPPKSKLVAWVVSNWHSRLYRVKYFQELKQHITVDVYGQNHQHLPRDRLLSTLAQYKFYLAFENSQHEDYITEKVWRNALSTGTVPVMLGPSRENYERFLPPDAFIHIDDFGSARELAQFLLALSEDAERYQRYFAWRQRLKPVVTEGWEIHMCRACHFLQTESRYHVVTKLSKWFR